MARVAAAWLAITFGGASSLAGAEADGPDHFRVRGVSPSTSLNLREAPSIESRRIARVPSDGTCLRNLGCQGGLSFEEFTTLSPTERKRREAEHPRWCKVEYQGNVGWVADRYLAEAPCP